MADLVEFNGSRPRVVFGLSSFLQDTCRVCWCPTLGLWAHHLSEKVVFGISTYAGGIQDGLQFLFKSTFGLCFLRLHFFFLCQLFQIFFVSLFIGCLDRFALRNKVLLRVNLLLDPISILVMNILHVVLLVGGQRVHAEPTGLSFSKIGRSDGCTVVES